MRTGGGFILLDKFIEVVAPLEEAKMMRAENITQKFKTNVGVNKVLGNDKNLYQLGKTNALVVGKNGTPVQKKK